jgi:uncharacterized membrane-anchored protein YhcB (DUF1043 family)
MLTMYDVLKTEKDQADIFKHYISDYYSKDNEILIKNIFRDIDNVYKHLTF